MSPAPNWKHQQISAYILSVLFNFLKGKPCKVLAAPVDVRLNPAENDDTVVQPDLLVVCDSSKLDDHGVVGAPDMVIEILSPSTAKRDKVLKFNAYRQAGVMEYWIVDPSSQTLAVHILKDGEYITRRYGDTDVVPVYTLEGCVINMAEVFI
jgi:Uma2 family endonuclease